MGFPSCRRPRARRRLFKYDEALERLEDAILEAGQRGLEEKVSAVLHIVKGKHSDLRQASTRFPRVAFSGVQLQAGSLLFNANATWPLLALTPSCSSATPMPLAHVVLQTHVPLDPQCPSLRLQP